jgi:hypothetical protein
VGRHKTFCPVGVTQVKSTKSALFGLFEETATSYLHFRFRVDKQKRPFKKKKPQFLNEVRRFTLRPVCVLKAPCPAHLSFQQRNITPFNKDRLRVPCVREIVFAVFLSYRCRGVAHNRNSGSFFGPSYACPVLDPNAIYWYGISTARHASSLCFEGPAFNSLSTRRMFRIKSLYSLWILPQNSPLHEEWCLLGCYAVWLL